MPKIGCFYVNVCESSLLCNEEIKYLGYFLANRGYWTWFIPSVTIKGNSKGRNKLVNSKLGEANHLKSTDKIIDIECLRLSSDGSGVGYHEGKATFVPGLLPGEVGQVQIVEHKKNWQRGKLLSIVKDSEDRVNPPCTVFSACGGCQLQHLRYEKTLEWKKRWVEDALSRIGKIPLDGIKIHPTIGMDEPWRYRNKSRIHCGDQNILGYYQEKSKSTVRFSDCLLVSESMNRWIKKSEEILQKNLDFNAVNTITFRENSRGEGMVILDPVRDEGPHSLFGIQLKNSENMIRSVWGIDSKGTPERIHGKGEFAEELLGFEFKISPLAFLQVNPIQTRKLYNTVLQWAKLPDEKVVWDLYSGIGTITLALAAKAKKVWGIEENPFAVEDAKVNAKLNQVGNVEFVAGKVEDVFQQITECPDIVVLDPPRAGAHRKVLEGLIVKKPSRIIYVSCDPGTLARDLGILQAGQYQVDQVQPVDMFPWTQHVESIIMMTYSGQKGK
jgi:23S rRNA (uracil1939-C5)-methyltransferase